MYFNFFEAEKCKGLHLLYFSENMEANPNLWYVLFRVTNDWLYFLYAWPGCDRNAVAF